MLAALVLSTISVSPVTIPADGSTAIATQAVNAFGLDLFRQVAKADAIALLSPYSIQNTLAMAYAGAAGVTREEVARVLHYPKADAQPHFSFAALRRSLDETVGTSVKRATELQRQASADARMEPMTLSVASRLFGQAGYQFHEPFMVLLKEQYAAPFQPVDFRGQAADATRQINNWVEQQTRQRIRDVIPVGALDELTRLVVVNAIYFKAPWEKCFSTEATQPAPFWVNGVKEVRVPTMNQTETLDYANVDGFCAVSLF